MTILILLLIIVFILCRKKNDLSFDMDNTAFLKAILPFFIIYHHGFMNNPDARILGVYVVALFFFVSGYGLECKRLKNNGVAIEWGGGNK